METKFTKGVWQIDIESDGNMWIAQENNTKPIANVCSGFNSQTRKYEPTEEEKANAQFIIGAHDLLAACVEFVRKCDCGEAKSKRSYKQMKEAIAKATE